jgi:HK97 gp10 family phage protein
MATRAAGVPAAGKARASLRLRLFGVKELDRALKGLEPKVRRKVISRAIRTALKVVKAAVEAAAPVGESGNLRRSVVVRAVKGRKRGVIALEVRIGEGNFKGKTYYAAFIEFGTKDIPAHGFMRKAFDETKDQARIIAMNEILAGVKREAAASR